MSDTTKDEPTDEPIDPRLVPFRDALAEMLVEWALQQPQFAHLRERAEPQRGHDAPAAARRTLEGLRALRGDATR